MAQTKARETWSEDAIGRLRALWRQGMSTNAIGRSLGVSKNAIIGKAHRMGLPARPSPIVRDRRAKPAGMLARPPVPSLIDLQKAADVLAAACGARSAARLDQQDSDRQDRPHGMARRPAGTATKAATAAPVAESRPSPIATSPALTVDPPQRRARASVCRWPIGDPGTQSFRFCDQPASTGKPYCDEHTRRAYSRTPRATAKAGNANPD